ncbi:MAG: hypothetical protein ACFFD4_11580 [Candidatus Odinarchaeota archaeon]
MVVEEISCPHCGNLTGIGIPSGTEITQIRKKSFWNVFSEAPIGSTRMTTPCEHCKGELAVWFRSKKN